MSAGKHRDPITHSKYTLAIGCGKRESGWIAEPVVRDIDTARSQRLADCLLSKLLRQNVRDHAAKADLVRVKGYTIEDLVLMGVVGTDASEGMLC